MSPQFFSDEPVDVLKSARGRHLIYKWESSATVPVRSMREATSVLRGSVKKHEQLVEQIRLVEIPATKDALSKIQGDLTGQLNWDTHSAGDGRKSLFPGSQMWAKETDGILIETPWNFGPYVYLNMMNGDGRSGPSHNWRGVLMYDTQAFNLEEFLPKFNMQSRATKQMLGYSWILHLVGWLAQRYIECAQNEIREIDDRIKTVIENGRDARTRVLSRSLLELNSCSFRIRDLQLDQQFAFSSELVSWASGLMKSSDRLSTAQRLLEVTSKHPELRPEQLRDKIAQTRAELTDLAAQQRQEQEEIQRSRAYQLQELSLRIAEDSRRDSRTMRGIAWVTMAFLPATFITSFFGMNFFDGIADGRVFDGTSRNIWVFFVIALPISAMVLVIFWWWDRKTQVLERVEREAREKALVS